MMIGSLRERKNKADLLKESKIGNLFFCTDKTEMVPDRGE
jgi:hypothetical protein